MSRQSEWQKRKRALGLCSQCGKGPLLGKELCRICLVKRRSLERKRLGLKAWVPGCGGTIPYTASESEIADHVLMRLYAH